MITNKDRMVIQISKFILPLILQHFLPKFFLQVHNVFAKLFIDENTGIFQKFHIFKYFLFLFKLDDTTNYCARMILIFLFQ